MTTNQKAKCPECGREIGRGLAGHKGSRRCIAYQEQDKAEESGLERVFESPKERSDRLLELIEEYGELETYETAYSEGSQNKRSELHERYYADPEAIRRAAREYLPNTWVNAERAEIVKRVEHDGNQWLILAHDATRRTHLFTHEERREDLMTGDKQVRELLAVRVEQPSIAEYREVVYVGPTSIGRDRWRTELCGYTCHGELVGRVEQDRTVVVDDPTPRGTLRIDTGTEVRGFDHEHPGMIDFTAHVAVAPGRVVTRDDIKPNDRHNTDELRDSRSGDTDERTVRVAELTQHGDAVALTNGRLIRLSEMRNESTIKEDKIAESYDKSTAEMRPAAVTAVQLGDQLLLESATLSGTTTDWEQ